MSPLSQVKMSPFSLGSKSMESRGCILMSHKELERVALLEKIKCKKITQVKAAKILNLSKSQVIRLYAAYKQFGAAGIVSKRRGVRSNNRLPQSKKMKLPSLLLLTITTLARRWHMKSLLSSIRSTCRLRVCGRSC